MTFTVYALRQLRTQVLGYGIGLGIYAAVVTLLFPVMEETLSELTASYPEGILEAFGVSGVSLADPRGFLSAEFFSFAPVIFAAFGLFASTGALAGEEGSGTLELTATLPISRRELFLRKAVAIALAGVATASLICIGWIVTVPFVDFDGRLSLIALIGATFGQLSFVTFIVAVGFLLGALAPSRGSASAWCGMILVASYLIMSIAGAVEQVRWIRYASPYYYTDLAQVLTTGIDLLRAAGLWATTGFIGFVAMRAFERREIGGQGWQFAALAFRRGDRGSG